MEVKIITFNGWCYISFLKLIFFFKNNSSCLFFFILIYLFYLWLCWVFVSVRRLSLVVASGGHSSSRCAGLSLSWPLLLQSTGSRRAGSAIVAHGPSCSTACGILPDQGSNPCPLHWQADSQPLRHQGSPKTHIFKIRIETQLEFSSLNKSSRESFKWLPNSCLFHNVFQDWMGKSFLIHKTNQLLDGMLSSNFKHYSCQQS